MVFLSVSFATIALSQAHQFREEEIFIPWVKAGQGLDSLLVSADVPEKHPLVVMTHGTSRDREQRDEVTAWSMLPQAVWFARRGWLVLAVVRRGYGKSGGRPDYVGHPCPRTDYQDAGEQSAEDLRRAIAYGKTLPNVEGSQIIAVGVSTGGFATVALTADAPPGLGAAINFAGGRGSRASNDVCNPDDLVRAFHNFGKHSRTPMLWIYAENDTYFRPELSTKFDAAFRAGGGDDVFVRAPAFGQDGHALFRSGIAIWAPIVDNFLKNHNLSPLPEPLPAPETPDIPPPAGLSEAGQRAFRRYLALGPHKAFAMSAHSFGLSAARMTVDEAKKYAIENCKRTAQAGEPCNVVAVDSGIQGK